MNRNLDKIRYVCQGSWFFVLVMGTLLVGTSTSSQTKYRKALLLNQSVGGQIFDNTNVNCGASSVTAKTSVVTYNSTHGLSGSDSVSMNKQYYPSIGNNSYNTWHKIFDHQLTTDWNNLQNYRSLYSVIIIKACFAYEGGHTAEGSEDDIPYRDSRRTTWLTKWHVRAIVDSMKKMPSTFWVIWTQIPIAQNENTTNAQRDKRIARWMKDTLAKGLDPVYGNNFPPNVYIFDAHSIMSDSNGKALFGCSSLDAHPTPTGIATVAPLFVNEVFNASISYEGGLPVPPKPQLRSPGNGSTGQPYNMTLKWHPTNYASNYFLQVSTDSLFSSFFLNDTTLTDTQKSVGPLAIATKYFWRVKAKNISGYSDWSDRWDFTTSDQTNYYVYHSGWNIVSVPLSVNDYSVGSIFPAATSDAFDYQGSYIPRDTLMQGKGYWIKFDEELYLPLDGTPFYSETLSVQTGWNLVGTISDTIETDSIITIPAGIIDSPFYDYDGSYTSVSKLTPGHGYWVKISESGDIIIQRNP